MRLTIRGQHMRTGEVLREIIDRHLQSCLSRFSRRIRSADVQLADVNGPRGGVDKRCRIAVRVQPKNTVIAVAQEADALAAVARASERVVRAVARKLERRRERRKREVPAETEGA